MVDFKKRLAKQVVEKPLNPADIYDRLDRASDKGPLRPAQSAVLVKWHEELRGTPDVIVKMHTGQGKTLVGLLMLQSKINETEKPVLYICPNKFLVNQTVSQASQFGVRCVTIEDDIPREFLDGEAILVTHVQKLFNGLTKFGLGASATSVGSLLIDDAHACIDAIRASCVIHLASRDAAYIEIVNLFARDLEEQGAGTFADIKAGAYGALLPVPYWAWMDRVDEVTAILARHAASTAVKFAWPLVKNTLADCLCVTSGEALEISPYQPPLHAFGTYDRAQHRVFMSATVIDDSFLIKGLGLSEQVVAEPLTYAGEKWAGEKMILIPSLIDPSLADADIIETLAKPRAGRKYGIVVLCPSFDACKRWEAAGATGATTTDIDQKVEKLRAAGGRDDVLVIANRYDGIDLPDDSCRLLVIDSKPFAEGLDARYIESCREGSDVVATRTARSIEQGLGRSVRGEKDYCVLLLIGASLIKAIRSKDSRKFFSDQTRMQIEIGLEIAELAKEEISAGEEPMRALLSLVGQCLRRDDAWKEYYVEQMNKLKATSSVPKALHFFAAELNAERKYMSGAYDEAAGILQKLIDEDVKHTSDRAWYLQEMARYKYAQSKDASNRLQVSAHQANRYLLKPKTGMIFSKVSTISQKRVGNIIRWVSSFETFNDLLLTVDDLLANLRFGVRAEAFEKALDSLAAVLGFAGQRPDKEWKEGPDNLWALRDSEYLLVECKSEVQLTRKNIHKDETGQMNNASAWFAKRYAGAKVWRILIIPTREVGVGAGFNDQVAIMTDKKLAALVKNVRAFFGEFSSLDLHNLSEEKVQKLIDRHGLSVDDVVTKYSEKVKP